MLPSPGHEVAEFERHSGRQETKGLQPLRLNSEAAQPSPAPFKRCVAHLHSRQRHGLFRLWMTSSFPLVCRLTVSCTTVAFV